MSGPRMAAVDRRRFLTRVIPACSFACLCAGALSATPGGEGDETTQGDVHKFDVEVDLTTTARQRVTGENRYLIKFIQALRGELDDEELIRLLNIYSAELGRDAGFRHAQRVPDTSFQSFVANFRPPNYRNTLTLDILEDSPKAFELRITECVWASVYRDAGLGGRIGYAAVCNMDNYWPAAFNERFTMVRDKTLMEGHDHCNHRYLDTT